MYASNVEEIDDWVYLNDRIYTGATNIFDHRSLSHSFSSSTSNSSNVLNRSSSLSSIPSIGTTSESSSEHFTHAVSSRRSSTFNRDELNVSTIEMSLMNQQIDPESCIDSDEKSRSAFIPYAFAVLIFMFPFIIGHAVGRWDQPSISKIYDELNKVNQKLNGINTMPSSSIVEDKLIVVLEKQLQEIEHQHQQWQDEESQRFSLEISALKLAFTEEQRNLTDLLKQLILENQRLRIQLNQLNNNIHIQVEQEDSVLDNQSCIDGINCKNSSETPSNHSWMNKIFKKTASIAENTSNNLFDLFERVSNSVSDILDHGQNYVERSQQKLISIAASITPSSLPKKIRRSVESFSSSINPRKWFKWPSIRRDQQKKYSIDRSPWRWQYQRRYSDQRTPYQSAYGEQEKDSSKCSFPVRQIRALKKWMVKFFRP